MLYNLLKILLVLIKISRKNRSITYPIKVFYRIYKKGYTVFFVYYINNGRVYKRIFFKVDTGFYMFNYDSIIKK